MSRRAYKRGDLDEYRFLYSDRSPCLPVMRDGQLFLVRWGNGRGQSRHLPHTGWTWLETIQQGGWKESGAVRIDIPATFAIDRGRWTRVIQGIRGILVPDERGWAVVYVICVPSTPYYRVMTGSRRMPVFIDQQI